MVVRRTDIPVSHRARVAPISFLFSVGHVLPCLSICRVGLVTPSIPTHYAYLVLRNSDDAPVITRDIRVGYTLDLCAVGS